LRVLQRHDVRWKDGCEYVDFIGFFYENSKMMNDEEFEEFASLSESHEVVRYYGGTRLTVVRTTGGRMFAWFPDEWYPLEVKGFTGDHLELLDDEFFGDITTLTQPGTINGQEMEVYSSLDPSFKDDALEIGFNVGLDFVRVNLEGHKYFRVVYGKAESHQGDVIKDVGPGLRMVRINREGQVTAKFVDVNSELLMTTTDLRTYTRKRLNRPKNVGSKFDIADLPKFLIRRGSKYVLAPVLYWKLEKCGMDVECFKRYLRSARYSYDEGYWTTTYKDATAAFRCGNLFGHGCCDCYSVVTVRSGTGPGEKEIHRFRREAIEMPALTMERGTAASFQTFHNVWVDRVRLYHISPTATHQPFSVAFGTYLGGWRDIRDEN
jgi:hypothetical protein